MSLVVKFITMHGLFLLFGAITTLFPVGNYNISGKQVTHQEWWSSEAGFTFLIVGIALGAGVICLVAKIKHSRTIYFSILCLLFLCTPLVDPGYLNRLDFIIPTIAVIGLMYWYLFHKISVVHYYETGSL